ncbi:RNA polymerase sigma factor [Enterococcus sp. AZ126]|uniref:RNA polymerase sigma factor n=1 Tax=Enterococcus sp. AZ126 TaxID=2774635 RepID=UPI003F26923D
MENDLQIRLVKKAKKGEGKAFIELCNEYQNILYNSAFKILGNKEDVDDCLQETEIIAWKRIVNLKNESAFNSWIFKIMINNAKDILKKRKQHTLFDESYHTEIPNENIESIEILKCLPDIYRIPVILHYYAGFTTKEISNQLNISNSSVKTRLFRGRKELKKLLESESK